MQSRLIEPPVLEPFTLAEVKTALRVTHNIQDDYIWTLAKSARRMCEDAARASISPQRWLTAYRAPNRRGDEFGLTDSITDPERILTRMVLPRQPVIDVLSLELVAANGADRIQFQPNVHYFFDPLFGQVTWVDRDVLRMITDPFYPTIEVHYACGFPVLNPGATNPLVADRTQRQVQCDDYVREAIFIVAAAGYDDPDGGMSKIPDRAIQLLRPLWTDPRMTG